MQYTDPEHMSEELARGLSVVMNYRSDEDDGSFCARSAVIQTRNIRLVASTSSAMTVEARGASCGFLMVPLHGFTSTQREGRTIEWGQGKAAVFLPPGGCNARSTARSVVGIDIDPDAINRVTQVMLGGTAPKRQNAFDFSTPSTVDLRGNNLDFGSILKSAISTLDLFGGDAQLIERSALDDVVLRMVALRFNFEELSAAEPDTKVQRAVIHLVCEYIDANLTNTITLTDLELVAGISRRSLQHAFRASFDCTPMEWVAQRRLEAVRGQILAARPGAMLTTIAGEYFVNLGEFARMYRQRYGELPSATLKHAIAKRLRS